MIPMRTLVILGGGTAGTMTANKLLDRLDPADWRIVVVDKDDNHDYQPGYIFVPFGMNKPKQIRKPRHDFIHDGIDYLTGEIDRVDPEGRVVHLADGRDPVSYTHLDVYKRQVSHGTGSFTRRRLRYDYMPADKAKEYTKTT